jgi:hypothetical protein
MSKGPPLRFDVPPTKWFVDRNLHRVAEFQLHFALKNGQGELTISDLVLDTEGDFKAEVFGNNSQFKRDIENNLCDAFCVLISTVLHRMNKDTLFHNRPCRLTVRQMPDKPLAKKP